MDKRASRFRFDPVEQASAWFVEFRAGEATPAMRVQFEEWLRASPEHIQAYLEIAAGWSELPIADSEGRIDLKALVAAARNSSDDNVVPLCQANAATPSAPRRARPLALAASLALLVILIGGGSWFLMRQSRTYSTGIGEQRTLILADGSTVILNALTTMRVHMTKNVREITLVRGQAYFHDVDESDRPFIVYSDGHAVRALGTQFDVDKQPNAIVVTVVQGRVAVAGSPAGTDGFVHRSVNNETARLPVNLKPVVVSAGEQVTVLAQNVAIPAPKRVDVAAVTGWMQQRLIFDDTPLEKVAERFNLYSRRRLVIADPSLRTVGVSGVYSAADPAALIGFLRSQRTLQVVSNGDQIVVTRRQRR